MQAGRVSTQPLSLYSHPAFFFFFLKQGLGVGGGLKQKARGPRMRGYEGGGAR